MISIPIVINGVIRLSLGQDTTVSEGFLKPKVVRFDVYRHVHPIYKWVTIKNIVSYDDISKNRICYHDEIGNFYNTSSLTSITLVNREFINVEQSINSILDIINRSINTHKRSDIS